jgi:hypothetical protein
MTFPASENELARKSKEMNNGSMPRQMDNKDYGRKRSAKNHKFSVKDSKTGKVYWNPAIAENLTFSQYLILEDKESKVLDKLTTLPDSIVGELKKLIRKGAQDINQNWENAKELVDTAYHVGRIRRPVPDQRGAWKQYEELLKHGVNELWKTRGNKGSWRSADVMYSENCDQPSIESLYEDVGSSRFFVAIPNAMDVEIEADDLSHAIRDMLNKLRRHGTTAEVTHRTHEGAILTVMKHGEPVEEIIIKHIS